MSKLSKTCKVKETKDHLTVLYGGVTLVKFSKSTLKVFLAELGPDTKVSVTREKVIKRKKRKSKVTVAEETITKAKQLVRAYTERKRKFFHSKAVNSIPTSAPEFNYFVDAVTIITRHKVTYKKFIEAQLAGLKFVGGGQGIFPKPNQLANEAAETRLLEYLREHDGIGHKEIPTIKISREERETPLLYNSKYLKALDAVKNKSATIEETVYVRELQILRLNKTKKYVDKYLERFT